MNINPTLKDFVNKIDEWGKTITYEDVKDHIWSDNDLIEYFKHIGVDQPTIYLTSSIEDAIVSSDNSKILVVGDGIGRLSTNIAKTYSNSFVVNIDSSFSMVEIANRLSTKNKLSNRLTNILADARNIPYSNNYFSYSIAYGVIQYLPIEEHIVLFNEIKRVSSNGITIAEASEGDLIKNLSQSINSSIIETPMEMHRMTLFYLLLLNYRTDKKFKHIVEKEMKDNQMNYVSILANLAGKSNQILYELKIT